MPERSSHNSCSRSQLLRLYVNDNGGDRPKSGDLVLDSITLDGKRDAYVPQQTPSTPSDAEPQIVDDFSEYADDEALRSAWDSRNHTEVLSLTDGPTNGSKALRFKYGFGNGGWYDVAQYLGGKNWSGEGMLKLQVRGDGSGNAIGLQIGTMDGKYFHYDIKLDFEGWKQLEIPLVGNGELTQTWPDDTNKGKSMTDADLTSIKEMVFASNKWNAESTGIDFAIADIQVVPATGSPPTPMHRRTTPAKARSRTMPRMTSRTPPPTSPIRIRRAARSPTTHPTPQIAATALRPTPPRSPARRRPMRRNPPRRRRRPKPCRTQVPASSTSLPR